MRFLAAIAVLLAASGTASAQGAILVEHGSPIRYTANAADPEITPPDAWTGNGFDDTAWAEGFLGIGNDTSAAGARGLLRTEVPFGTKSIYTRATFQIDDPGSVGNLFFGADWDDGYVAWLNGVEIVRAPEMPGGPPAWDSTPALHECSNNGGPDYGALIDVSAAIGQLVAGPNVLAVGAYNASTASSDLVLSVTLLRDVASVELLRGPYLQDMRHDGVTVRWRTSQSVASRVLYGSSPDDLSSFSVVSGARTDHEVVLSGLTPDTPYFYAVGTGGEVVSGGDTLHRFRTAPVPGSRQRLRIWALGDSGTANGEAGAVRNAYENLVEGGREADVWLMLGDNAYDDGSDEQYQAAVFETYPTQLRRMPLWPTIGNHDNFDPGSQADPYYDIFTMPTGGPMASGTESYYSFDYANVHFLVLNSEEVDPTPSSAMLTWAAADLADTTQDWVIAYWHHPPYSKGSHDSDTELYLERMRVNALPILEEGGVDLVLCGHSHSYERTMLLDGHYDDSDTLTAQMKVDDGDGRIEGDGAYRKASRGTAPHQGSLYVVAGSSGKTTAGVLDHPAMVFDAERLGSLLLDVEGDRIEGTFLDDLGVALDTFAIVKNTFVFPNADFTADPLAGPAPLTVRFDDLSSTNAAAWSWDFEDDGTIDSAAREPAHVYSAPGVYDVMLSVQNDVGGDTTHRPGLICVTDAVAQPVAGVSFEADRRTLRWTALAGAEVYDVVGGNLDLLATGVGGSLLGCVMNDTTATEIETPDGPASGGRFYLVRGMNCADEVGSYDSGGQSQSGARDDALPAPPKDCP